MFTSHALSRCLPFAVLAIAAVGFATVPVFAQEITVIKLPCGGFPVWLWAEGADATCQDLGSGLMACEDAAGEDFASGSCSSGCEEVRSGNIAGCFRGDGPPDIYKPNFTLICPNGRKFDLKGAPNHTCGVSERDKAGNSTAAKCSKKEDGKAEVVSAEANCTDGCVSDTNPGECKER